MAGSKRRFVFITPFIEEDFFVTVKRGIRDAEKLFGVDVKFTGTRDADVPELKRLVERYRDENYDGIALSLCHPTEFNQTVDSVLARGVPVVAFNIDSRDSGNRRMSSICQNLFEAGRTLGIAALPHLSIGASVLMTMHDEGIAALEERLAGELDIISVKQVKSTVLVTGNTPQHAADSIQRALELDSNISAILCTGQSDTEGAAIAAGTIKGMRDLYVAGFDLSPGIIEYIEKGIVDFTVDQQPYVQGFYPVLQLYLYCSHGIKPSNIDTGAAIVDKINVEAVRESNRLGYR